MEAMMGRRTALCAVLAAGLLTTSGASAAASAPEKIPFDQPFVGVFTTLCPFPVQYSGRQTGFALLFYARTVPWSEYRSTGRTKTY
jgi:hypothetical protein